MILTKYLAGNKQVIVMSLLSQMKTLNTVGDMTQFRVI